MLYNASNISWIDDNSFYDSVYCETIKSIQQKTLEPMYASPNASTIIVLGIEINNTQIKEEGLDILYAACASQNALLQELS